jgi:hypothetical protein
MHDHFGTWYVTERRCKRRQRHLDLRVGTDCQSDGTRALRKMRCGLASRREIGEPQALLSGLTDVRFTPDIQRRQLDVRLVPIADISSDMISIKSYVLHRRVKRAKELLADPKMSQAQIAFAAGFSDQSHYTRWFRQISGLTPGGYRWLTR